MKATVVTNFNGGFQIQSIGQYSTEQYHNRYSPRKIQSIGQYSTEQYHNRYSPRKIQLRISLFTAREVG